MRVCAQTQVLDNATLPPSVVVHSLTATTSTTTTTATTTTTTTTTTNTKIDRVSGHC